MDDFRAKFDATLDRLPELSETELSDLEQNIIQAFGEVEAQEISRDSVAEMTYLAESVETVRTEMANREAEKAELAAQASEAATRISSEEPSEAAEAVAEASTEPPATFAAEATEAVVADASEGIETSATEASAMVEDEEMDEEMVEEMLGDEAAPAIDEVTDEDENTDPVFAASEDDTTTSAEAHMGNTVAEPTSFSAPADRLPVARPGATPAPVSLVAGGDIPGVSAGAPLADRSALAEAMSMRLHSLRRASGGSGEQVVVASLLASFPEERTLRGNELDSNSEKIKAITEPSTIVASGGFCAPLPVNYDIFNIGDSTATPLRDSLPVFNADRGGVRFVKPPTFGDYAGAIGTWTNQNDIDAGTPGLPDPTKPCLHVNCAAEDEVYLDAITMCLCFGNLQTRAFPELIARHNELALVQAARYAEQYVMEAIKAASTAVTLPAVLGAARDLLIAVERAAVFYRHQSRLDPDLPLRFVAPQWLQAMVRSDLTAQLPGDGMDTTFGLSDADLNGFFTDRNIRPVWTMEGTGDQPTATDYPDTVEWGLFAEGTFTLLDGGTLDIGIVRDQALVSTNDYCMFTEQFLGVAMTGTDSLWVSQGLNVNGGSAGTLDVSTVDY